MKNIIQIILVFFIIIGLLSYAIQAQESVTEPKQIIQVTASTQGPTNPTELAFIWFLSYWKLLGLHF